MREAEEIRRKLFGNEINPDTVFMAVVTETDESDFSCTVQVNDMVFYYDVRLRGVVNPDLKGAAFIPKIGSKVLVCRIGGSNELFVAMFTEIDKIIFTNEKMAFTLDQEQVLFEHENVSLAIESGKMSLDVDGSTAELSKDGIVFNAGSLGGLVKVNELTDKINALIDAFNNHTHTIMSGGIQTEGSPAKQANVAPVNVPKITSPHTKVAVSDYENDKVKH